MSKPVICIKIGGKMAADESVIFGMMKEIAELKEYSFFIVHGGGAEVTEASKAFGIEAKFENGIRITSESEMKIVDAVLAGKMNKQLVRLCSKAGLTAAGLSGSDGKSFTGKAIADFTRTGKITAVDTTLTKLIIDAGMIPVLASTSMDAAFDGLNINADEAALELSKAMKVEKLVFISDIIGVMKDGALIPELNEKRMEDEIAAGVISGGMIPKVRSSLDAVKHGAKSVIICTYEKEGSLKAILAGKSGTKIIA